MMENRQVGKFSHPLIWCSGVAMALVCAGGIVVAYMRWFPTSIESRGDNAVPVNLSAAQAEPAGAKGPIAQATSPGPLRATCGECGVTKSTREIQEPVARGCGVGGSRRPTAEASSEIHQGANVAPVIDWHPYARHGMGCARPALLAREPGAKPAESKYEFTLRFRDESSHVFGETNPPAWRLGAPVKVIEGEVPLIG